MPIKTNLNVSPYFDDFDKTKDYYRILFQPGVSVQTRELNQLQTMFQQQVERFGDNIFSAGTIVSGCNFSFNNPYPYIKIRDLTFDGTTAIPFGYVNFNIINDTTGLTAASQLLHLMPEMFFEFLTPYRMVLNRLISSMVELDLQIPILQLLFLHS